MLVIYAAWVAAVIAIALLLLRPFFGVRFLLMVKGVIDVGWNSGFGPFALTKIVSGLVPLLVLPRILFSGKVPLRTMPLFGISILYLTANFSGFAMILVKGDISEALEFALRVLNGFLGFFMFQHYFADRDSFRKLIIALLVAGIIPMCIGLYSQVTGVSWREQASTGGLIRQSGLYHDIVTLRFYAFVALAGIGLTWEYLRPQSTVIKSALFGYVLVCSYIILTTYSKSAILIFVTWSGVWLILKRRYSLLFLLPLLYLALSVIAPHDVSDIAGKVFLKELGVLEGEVDSDRMLQGRPIVWQRMLEGWQNASLPAQLFGLGTDAGNAHNDFLRTLLSTGLLGLVVYISMLLTAAFAIGRALLQRASPLRIIALMFFLMWIIDSIGTVPGMYPMYQWIIWGFIGLALRGVDGLDDSPKYYKYAQRHTRQ